MKTAVNRLNRLLCVTVIPLLLIILFGYTGAAKLTGHAKFLSQLENTGLDKLLAEISSYTVPVAELLLAVLLCIGKRTAGLWLSALAMTFFTGYVAIILSGRNLPCSCGGVISSMGWKRHLYFNIIFLLLSIWSLLYHKRYYAHIRE